jgi:hypothetical protein
MPYPIPSYENSPAFGQIMSGLQFRETNPLYGNSVHILNTPIILAINWSPETTIRGLVFWPAQSRGGVEQWLGSSRWAGHQWRPDRSLRRSGRGKGS